MIVLISKPPAKEIATQILTLATKTDKRGGVLHRRRPGGDPFLWPTCALSLEDAPIRRWPY